MTSQKGLGDCYFYFYSSCTKGDLCPFRHCEAALGTETVCSLWREGRCFKSTCKFRHMESQINRATVPCYWENQPGGCRKPHCVFLHRRSRGGVSSANENSGLILPVSNSPAVSNSPKSEEAMVPSPRSSPRLDMLGEYVPDSTSVPVTPIVVRFDEESDNESVSSTPVKTFSDSSKPDQVGSARNNLLSKLTESSDKKDFGVKTLEQIKMEKIHKESEHFYKSDDLLGNGIPKLGLKSSRNATLLLNDTAFCYPEYDVPALTDDQKQLSKIQKSNGCYPPNSEFISLSETADASSDKTPYAKTKETSSQEKESYMRGRLLNRNSFLSSKVAPDKRVINFKKQNKKAEVSSDSLNFKIKTLDEIRREKEKKQGAKDDGSTPCCKVSIENKAQSSVQKPSKRLKLTRKSTDLKAQPVFNTEGGGDSALINSKIETKEPQMVLHEMQANQTEPKKPSSVRTTIALGKRKVTEELAVKNKVQKNEEAKNENISVNGVNLPQKQIVSGLRAFLRRPLTKPPPATAVITTSPPGSADLQAVPAAVVEPQGVPTEPKEVPSIEDCSISSTTLEEGPKTPTTTLEEDRQTPTTIMEEDRQTPTTTLEEGPKTPTTTMETPTTPTEEKSRTKSLSVDEFDSFLMEADMNVDEVEETDGGDDILLEMDQFLES